MSTDYTQMTVTDHMRMVGAACEAQFYLEDGNIYDRDSKEPLPVCFRTVQEGRHLGYLEIACILYGYPIFGEDYALFVDPNSSYPADPDNIAIGNAQHDLEMENDREVIDFREEQPDADIYHVRLLDDILKDIEEYEDAMWH